MGRATIVPKCMHRCDIIFWLVRLKTFDPRATFEPRATRVPGPKGLRGRRPHSNCVCVCVSQSVCVGVTLSLGWLVVRGRRPHANRVRHSNCVSSNRVQQLFQSVCVGVTLSFGWLG